MDAYYTDQPKAHAAWLAKHPRYKGAEGKMLDSPEVKRFARDAFYRDALAPSRAAFAAHSDDVQDMADALSVLTPALVVDRAMQSLAGSDKRRYADFIASTDGYTERLRQFFHPSALANAQRVARTCPSCPGRMTFSDYDKVPQYSAKVARGAGALQVALTIVYLLLLVLVIVVVATKRLKRWPL